MKTKIFALLLCLVLLLTGCGKKDKNEGYQNPEEQGTTADLGDDNKSFGESLDDLGAYGGYFEDESTDIVVECVSGTQGAYKLEGTTLTFTAISLSFRRATLPVWRFWLPVSSCGGAEDDVPESLPGIPREVR